MSEVDTHTEETVPVATYVGWIWGTAVLAILAWGASVALVVIDALDDLPNPSIYATLTLAACATVVCAQTLLAYAQRRATHTCVDTVARRSSAAATTMEMRRIRVGHVYGVSRTVECGSPGWPAGDREDLRERLAGAVPIEEASQMASVSFELGKRIERRKHNDE